MISTTYAALLAILFVFLSVRTLRLRRHLKIAIGDGNNQRLLRAMRVHANFAEYVPFALILIYGCESLDGPPILLNVLGVALLLGRLLHAFGVSREREQFVFRVAGMTATFVCYLIAASYLLYRAFASMKAWH